MNEASPDPDAAPARGTFPAEQVRPFGADIDHSEGVAVGPDGFVYAGGELGQIYRISPDGRTTQQLACTGGFTLGLTLDRAGNVFACNHVLRAVLRIDPAGHVTHFCDRAGPRAFQTPNFAVLDSDGNLYLSDSGQFKKNNGLIYRISPDGVARVFHPGPFAFPNGLALSAAEDALFVIESNTDGIRRLMIKRDGTCGGDDAFCTGLAHVPDGMAFDSVGHLIVACYGLNRLYDVDPAGRVTLLCEDVENAHLCTPTNLAFGGPELRRLFIGMLGARHLGVVDVARPGMALVGQRSR